jgi:hypothetical protein
MVRTAGFSVQGGVHQPFVTPVTTVTTQSMKRLSNIFLAGCSPEVGSVLCLMLDNSFEIGGDSGDNPYTQASTSGKLCHHPMFCLVTRGVTVVTKSRCHPPISTLSPPLLAGMVTNLFITERWS